MVKFFKIAMGCGTIIVGFFAGSAGVGVDAALWFIASAVFFNNL